MNTAASIIPIIRRETIANCTQAIVDCASAKAIVLSYTDGGIDELAYSGVAKTLLCHDDQRPYFTDDSNRAVINVMCYVSITKQVERS